MFVGSPKNFIYYKRHQHDHYLQANFSPKCITFKNVFIKVKKNFFKCYSDDLVPASLAYCTKH